MNFDVLKSSDMGSKTSLAITFDQSTTMVDTLELSGIKLDPNLFQLATFSLEYTLYDLFTQQTIQVPPHTFLVRYIPQRRRWVFHYESQLGKLHATPYYSISLCINPFLELETNNSSEAEHEASTMVRANFLDSIEGDPATSLIINQSGIFCIYFVHNGEILKSLTISKIVPLPEEVL